MSDFLDLQGAKDLNTDAIHIGAVANSVDQVTGLPIDTHVNRAGGTDYTFKGMWGALGPVVMPWTSVVGGTLTQPNQAFLHPANGNYYSWTGAYPAGGYVVAPGTDPALPGSGYVPRTDVVLRSDLLSDTGSDNIAYNNIALSMTNQSLSKRLVSDIYLSDYSALVADGVSNDAAVLLQAINDAKTISNSGMRPVIKFPVGKKILIKFSKGSALTPTVDHVETNSFYCFNDWLDTDFHGDRGVTFDLNGSVILVDGDANSIFMGSSEHVKCQFKNGKIKNISSASMASGFVMTLLWSTWIEVTIYGFKNGRAVVIYGERNTFFGLNLINNLTHLRLGGPELGSWDNNQANENRFYGLNMMDGGLSLAEPDNITCGFLEIYSSQCPRFFGGSWKPNKNPMMIFGCWSGTFDGIYFESSGLPYSGGVWPNDTNTPPRARRLHCIFDATASPISNVVCAINNIVFRNCFFGGFSNFLFRAGWRHFGDGVGRQMHIDGVTFEDCTWGDQVFMLHDSASDTSFMHNIKIHGPKYWGGIVGTPLGVGQQYSSIQQDMAIWQYQVSYPIAHDGPDFFTGPQFPISGISSGRQNMESYPDGIKIGGESNQVLRTYKESTFTPKLYAAGVDASATYGVTYSFAQGQAIKIGRVVYAELFLYIASKGTLTGTEQITIGNLPYPPGGIDSYGGNESAVSIVDSYSNFTGITGDVRAIIDAGTDRLTLKHDAGNSFVLASNLTATSGIRIGMTYVSET